MKKNFYKTAVLTDVPYGMPIKFIQKDIESLIPYLDSIISSCTFGFRKPNPNGLIRLADKYECLVDNIIFIGNEKKDIVCARLAGVKSVLVDPSGGKNYNQDFSIKKLIDLVRLL